MSRVAYENARTHTQIVICVMILLHQQAGASPESFLSFAPNLFDASLSIFFSRTLLLQSNVSHQVLYLFPNGL
jgi:hypothetical protein